MRTISPQRGKVKVTMIDLTRISRGTTLTLKSSGKSSTFTNWQLRSGDKPLSRPMDKSWALVVSTHSSKLVWSSSHSCLRTTFWRTLGWLSLVRESPKREVIKTARMSNSKPSRLALLCSTRTIKLRQCLPNSVASNQWTRSCNWYSRSWSKTWLF